MIDSLETYYSPTILLQDCPSVNEAVNQDTIVVDSVASTNSAQLGLYCVSEYAL